jgi:hypothetical protein
MLVVTEYNEEGLPSRLTSNGLRSTTEVMSEPSLPTATGDHMSTKSGIYWVTWADAHAKNSDKLDDLDASFKQNVDAFILALTNAGAKVDIRATKRDEKRAYLFHWSWLICQGKAKPSEADKMVGVDIEWDHGDDKKSKAAALEMVTGFGLAIPPASVNAPSLTSNHIAGKAVDMDITWSGTIKVKKKDGTEVSITYNEDVDGNTPLHAVGASYGVKKLNTDAPHWSFDGR